MRDSNLKKSVQTRRTRGQIMSPTLTDSLKPDSYQINAKICRLVEQHPCMYDRSSPYYLKKDVVDKAWVKISREMEDSVSSCKERWRNIRTSFARSININKIPASANRTKPYYLHEELKFLARHITPGIPVSRRCEMAEVALGEESLDDFRALSFNHDEDSADQMSSVDEGGSDSPGNKNQSSVQLSQMTTSHGCKKDQNRFIRHIVDSEDLVEEVPLIPNISMSSPIMSEMQGRKRQRSPELEIECEVKPQYTELLNSGSCESANDVDASFLQGLLPEMRTMDFHQKILFKRRIYEVISDIFAMPNSQKIQQQKDGNTQSMTSSAPFVAPITTPSMPASSQVVPVFNIISDSDLMMLRRLKTLLSPQKTAINITKPQVSSRASTPPSIASKAPQIPKIAKIFHTSTQGNDRSSTRMVDRMPNNQGVETLMQSTYTNASKASVDTKRSKRVKPNISHSRGDSINSSSELSQSATKYVPLRHTIKIESDTWDNNLNNQADSED